jgi:hypothetical protein
MGILGTLAVGRCVAVAPAFVVVPAAFGAVVVAGFFVVVVCADAAIARVAISAGAIARMETPQI